MLHGSLVGQSSFTLAEVMSVADEAKDYSRQRIKQGSTQLENNQLLEEYFIAHYNVVQAVRSKMDQGYSNDPLLRFEVCIKLSSKYSVGNCSEYAYQALDYMLCHDKLNLRAEVYLIEGGDHVFMVINRARGSSPSDPSTWGDAAVICDPWSNAVYPAREYLTKLKNYYRVPNRHNNLFTNRITSFNQDVHQLCPYKVFNTDVLRPGFNHEKLTETYKIKLKRVTDAVSMYREVLLREQVRLNKKYGKRDPKVVLLTKKIQHVDNVLGVVQIQSLHNDKKNNANFWDAKDKKEADFKDIYRSAISAMSFSAKEMKIVSTHKTHSSIRRKLYSFFGVRTRSQRKITRLSAKVNSKLNEPVNHDSSFGGWGFVLHYHSTSC